MQVFNFDQAGKLLLQHEADFPEDHPERPDFLFLQALALWQRVPPVQEDVVHALKILEDWVDRYPEHPMHPRALLYLGRIHDIRDYAGDIPDYDRARAAYNRFLNEHPNHELLGDAILRIAMTHIKQTNDADEMRKGVEILKTWHEANPDSQYAPLFALFLGNMYDQYLSSRELALQYYLQSYRIGFVNPGRAGVNTWRLVELAVERGLELAGGDPTVGFMDWDLSEIEPSYLEIAIEASQLIITDYARSGRGYEAVLLLRRIRQARSEMDFEIPVLQLFDLIRAEDEKI